MNIALYNLEPKYTNYALEKLRIYHSHHGDIVEDYLPLNYDKYDKVYCSSIFSFTKKQSYPDKFICGGTGFDLTTKLPDEIENITPKLNFGFTTRGCIRKCSFCVVPEKEGNIHIVSSLYDLWDGKSKDVVLFDNNIIALPKHFESVCNESIQYHIRLDFNQGLDHRLLTPELVSILKSISHVEYRFSFDDIQSMPTVKRAIKMLQQQNINRCNWYVLVGFNSSFNDDLKRLNYLRDNNQNAYVQRYKSYKSEGVEYIALARWVNQHHLFQAMTWKEFLDHPDNYNYKKLINQLGYYK